MLISPLGNNLDFVNPPNIKKLHGVIAVRARAQQDALVSVFIERKLLVTNENKTMMRNKVFSVANVYLRQENKTLLASR